MMDGFVVYQGGAKESAEYFEISKKAKTKTVNPCDYFMAELSVNYPKRERDEKKIAEWTNKYNATNKSATEKEMAKFRFAALKDENEAVEKSFCY